MRRPLIALIGLGLLAPLAPAREPGWLTDYAEAQALARRTGRPLLVVFR